MGKGRKEDESAAEERDGEDKEEASEDPPLPTIILPTPSLGGREGGGERDHVCEGVRWEGGNSESSEEWVSVNVSHPLNGD